MPLCSDGLGGVERAASPERDDHVGGDPRQAARGFRGSLRRRIGSDVVEHRLDATAARLLDARQHLARDSTRRRHDDAAARTQDVRESFENPPPKLDRDGVGEVHSP